MGAYSHRRAESLPLNIQEALSLLNEKNTDRDLEKQYLRDRDECEPVSTCSYLLDKGLRIACPASIFGFFARLLFAFLPSFIQTWLIRDSRHKPAKLFSTSYLDGIRGLAALFVFFCHFSYTFFKITHGYGYVEEWGVRTNWLSLPIVRLLYSGPPMVCIFFVVSGYALSLKPLKQIQSQQWTGLLNTLFSSIFRRWIRLYGPTTISTFIVLVLLRYNWYEGTREFASNKTFIRNIMEHHPEQLETVSEQAYDWGWSVFHFAHIWSWEQFGGSTPYDLHLWTIPVEFRASIVLFITLLALAKVRTWIRSTLLLCMMFFTYRWDRWEMVLFYSGAFLAEIDLIRAARHISSAAKSKSHLSKAFWITGALLGLYLMSQPDDDFEKTPGWIYLSTWIPEWVDTKYRFWQCYGSVLFLFCVCSFAPLQRPFNTPLVQYFGKISYALYLVHGPFNHVAGYRIMMWAWGKTGYETERQYVSGFLLGTLFVVPLTIWAADLFWRAADVPVVMFARWFESVCVVKEEAQTPILGSEKQARG